MNKKLFSILLVITLVFSSFSVYADNSSVPEAVVVPQAIVVPDDGGGTLQAPDGGMWELMEITDDYLYQIYDSIEYVPANIVYLKMGEVISETDRGIILGLLQDGSVASTEVIFKKYFSSSVVSTVIMPYFTTIFLVYDVGQTLLDINFRSQIVQAANQGKGIIVQLGHYGPAAGMYQGLSFKSAKVWDNYPYLQTPLSHIGSFTHY